MEENHYFTKLEEIRDALLNTEPKDIALAIKNTIARGYIMSNVTQLPSINTPYFQLTSVPYQLCPKCNGSGMSFKTQHTDGTINWSFGPVTCDVCNGAKIVPQAIVK